MQSGPGNAGQRAQGMLSVWIEICVHSVCLILQ
jgi:hypothetical protein